MSERGLLRPKQRAFYSVDALNPDVVARDGTYYMFFSGNDQHTPAGRWRTGLAVSRSPSGPFRVTSLRGDYLNGGTVVWRGRFYQASTFADGHGELASSRDGLHWGRIARVPQSPRGSRYTLTADYSLERTERGLRLYFLGRRTRSGPLYGEIASMEWRRGRWVRLRKLLTPGARPWEDLDLGEPASVRLRGVRHLFYVGLASKGLARSIGLAYEDRRGRWHRCGTRPVIPAGASWGPSVSIDPSPIVVGNRLHVYYGGGTNTSIASDLGGTIGVRVYRLPSNRPGAPD